MLIFRLEKEHQPPCQDSIEGSIKESRLLNRFTKDGCAGQVALECRNKRWCCIHPEDLMSFLHQYHGEGKARPATQIKNAAAAPQCFGPPPHFLHADGNRPSPAIAATRKKFF